MQVGYTYNTMSKQDGQDGIFTHAHATTPFSGRLTHAGKDRWPVLEQEYAFMA